MAAWNNKCNIFFFTARWLSAYRKRVKTTLLFTYWFNYLALCSSHWWETLTSFNQNLIRWNKKEKLLWSSMHEAAQTVCRWLDAGANCPGCWGIALLDAALKATRRAPSNLISFPEIWKFLLLTSRFILLLKTVGLDDVWRSLPMWIIPKLSHNHNDFLL